ncbi:MAG: type I restriction endonuclease subunit M, partial [Methanobacteriota archaeon]
IDAYLKVDFAAKKLVYPEDKGLVVNERQTCNFSANENFVVFEAVHRLFEKGYKPKHIKLEPRWQLGHGASGGRADILVKDFKGEPLLIIECKTPGKELRKAWKRMLVDGGQLFSYAQQERSTKFLCLYASDFDGSTLTYDNYIVTLVDNDNLLEERKAASPLAYRDAKSTEDLFRAWKETYAQDYMTVGIFEEDIPAYQIGKSKYTLKDLKPVAEKDIQPKYHEFATILRQHNVSGRENAFDKLVNLFLCKIVDEIQHPSDLQFYWKGIAYDSFFDLIDRLQRLYRDGMKQFLKEDVTYIDNQTIRDAFKFFKNDPDATRDKILEYFRKQKYFTNNDFAFIDVHNETLFYQNAAVLLKIVQMLQGLRLTGNNSHNQFLGDMFEFFLDQGFKQTEGQFFTPLPIVRF